MSGADGDGGTGPGLSRQLQRAPGPRFMHYAGVTRSREPHTHRCNRGRSQSTILHTTTAVLENGQQSGGLFDHVALILLFDSLVGIVIRCDVILGWKLFAAYLN